MKQFTALDYTNYFYSLIEALLTTSFKAHPCRNFLGWASDIEILRAKGGAPCEKARK